MLKLKDGGAHWVAATAGGVYSAMVYTEIIIIQYHQVGATAAASVATRMPLTEVVGNGIPRIYIIIIILKRARVSMATARAIII